VRGALGAAAGAVLGSCRPTASPDPQNPTPTSGPRQTPAVSGPRDWGALDDVIDGRVILPSSAEYGAAKNVFNSRFAASTPAAVVTVKSTDDVRKAVEFAAKDNIKIAARGGGHSYIGASAANGAMVIDLRQLAGDITYDDASELATVPAAAELDSVQTALAAHGRSIPSGSCPTVGIAGLTLGGGLGSDARRSGLTCDALVSASIVLPSGEAITASPDDHADLFWALRGGGGGNFGVVTSFTFRTSPVTDRDVVTLVFTDGTTEHAILGWYEWLRGADRAIWGMVNITAGPGSAGCIIVLATAPGDGPSRADDLCSAIGVQPVSNSSRTLNRMDFIHYFEGGDDATKPRAFVAGSDILGEMTSAAAESIVAATSAWPQTAGASTTVIESLSGAVADVQSDDTAFPWRRQAACVQWYVETPSPATVDSANQWLASAHQAVQANSVGGYVNYVEPDTAASRYFGGNLVRLSAIRQKYDPDGLMYSGIKL
ncbi:MAG TPA: FAD-binding oxidoreductase, partial [Mycobacterium sp.]|nr:FAD-binding oxidoreductase [Mycobacterium sp.]